MNTLIVELLQMRTNLLQEVCHIDAILDAARRQSGELPQSSEGECVAPERIVTKPGVSLELLRFQAVAVRISVPFYDPEEFVGLPGLESRRLTITVDLASGMIREWPDGFQAEYRVYDKVRDEGIYQLLDRDDTAIATRCGYVPDKLVPGEFGDYIDLIIKNGVITNWYTEPELNDFLDTTD